jgi:hypothetical protein
MPPNVDLAVREGHAARSRHGVVRSTRTAVQFDPLTPFDVWEHLGGRMGVYANATAWWLGDWLVFGQAKYGRRYKEAVAATGLDYQTLRNYAMVARRFGVSRRRDNLTFNHHAEVCALPEEEQEAWLDRAAAGAWSRNELRRRLRAARRGSLAAAEALRLELDRRRAERWRDAAALRGRALEGWAVEVLDAAAAAALEDRASPPSER